MTIRIKARTGESAEQLLRRFKKMCEKEGLTKDVKRQAYYEKPSEKARRSLRKSIKRSQMLLTGGVPIKGKSTGPMKPGQRPGPGGKFAKRGPVGKRPSF